MPSSKPQSFGDIPMTYNSPDKNALRNFILHSPLTITVALFAAVVTTFTAPAAAENTDRTKAERACRDGGTNIMICEDWEDGDHVGWTDFNATASWGPPVWGGHSCLTGNCTYSQAGYKSNQALVAYLTAGTFGTIYPTHSLPGLSSNDTIYARWYVRWSPGYEFNTSNNKNMFIFAGNDDFSFFVRPPRNARDTVDDPRLARPYIHTYCAQTDAQQDATYAAECSYSGGDLRYFPNVPGYENFVMKGGPEWYCVEVMVTPNPVGQSWGGKLKFWIDDVLMADYSNVSLRHATSSSPIDRIMVSSYWGGGGATSVHPDEYVVYDNIIVSKSRIGCMKTGDGPILPPTSPSKSASPAVQRTN
jgi:hypothetical protein